MFRFLKIKYLQFLEHCRQKGVGSAIKTVLFKEEEAVPVVKDLANLKKLAEPTGGGDLKLIEINQENFKEINIDYPTLSRKARASRYFRKGYRSFALVKEGEVLGDLWYVSKKDARAKVVHPHVDWFGIDLRDDDVYMFDMYFTPDGRGQALSTYFMNSVLHKLRESGYQNAYGYFASHNIPALWVHRLVGFRELPRFALRRYFLFETCKPKGTHAG